ncbi:MAG: cytochrome c [Bacteroidales bacterium]|nr:cytochrome c [Bacteroidales bacterium]
MKYFITTALIFILLPAFSWGQEWVVPENRKGKLSTFPFTDATRQSGEKLYTVNCKSCHGIPGRGNYLNLVPPPGDPATEKIQKNSDGEIFYKVSYGRGQMPSFRNVLSGDEIWNIVSYLRSFNSTYVQKVMEVITSAAYPGATIRMTMGYGDADSTVTVNALAIYDNRSVAVTGAGVRLFVHRYFGMMAVDEEKNTDENGNAFFSLPEGLPGDNAGNISFSAKFTDEEVFGTVSKDTVMRAGVITSRPSLLAERAMWNNVRKAPLWVILTYTLGVLAVWGFIVLTLLKLRDIYTIGSIIRGDLMTTIGAEAENQKV